MRILLFTIFSVFMLFTRPAIAIAQMATDESELKLINNNAAIYGTLKLAGGEKAMPVVLIISGSGPTDRDGNTPAGKNNSISMLSNALASNGISSLRYDKRGIGKSKIANLKEESLRFEDYISDAAAWIQKLKAE